MAACCWGTWRKTKIVQITKQNYSAGWHQIWYQNRLAYIKTKDVSVLAAAKAYVKTESLGMYTGASKTSSKLRTLSMGETVKVYGYSGSFALVIAHGDAGYVSKGSIIAKPPVVAAAKARSAQVTIYSSTHRGQKAARHHQKRRDAGCHQTEVHYGLASGVV